jgi:type VI secretion system protein ImpL
MNTLLLKKGADASERLVEEARSKDNGLYKDFQALTQVLDQYRTLVAYENRLPLSLALGVYEGDKQLPAVRSILLNSFEGAFYKPALKGLEMRLANYAQLWSAASLQRQDEIRDSYYLALKCYLMLSSPERLEPEFAVTVLQDIIQERLVGYVEGQKLEETDLQHLSEMTGIYLSHMLVEKEHPDYIAPLQLNAALVSDAQNHLKAVPDAGRLYTQILNKGKLKFPPIPLDNMIKGPGRGILTSSFKMPFMFTYEGWRTYAHPEITKLVNVASQGDWVTGYLQDNPSDTDDPTPSSSASDALSAQLEADIRALYFTDYVNQWLTLLGEVKLPPFRSLDDGAKKMLLLARNDGPIAELLQAVSRNINITRSGGVALSVDGSVKTASLVPELEAPLHDLRKLTDPGDKMNTSLLINQYLLALTSAQSQVEQMAAAVDVPLQSFQHAATILGGNDATVSELYKCWLSTNSLLNGIDARTRKAAERLLHEPIKGAWGAIIQQTQVHLQNQWNGSVVTDYQRKISGKFPFKGTGPDASLNDISDFFRPEDGLLWAFTEDQLKPFLRKERNRWTEKVWLGAGLNFNKDLLLSLNQASNITSGMFRRGQGQPDVQFSIYPVPSKGLRVVRFETNGQQLTYQNEPQEWKRFHWPGDQDRNSSLIGCIPSGSNSMTKLKYSGDWSLFHLLQEASVSWQSNKYYLVWKLKTDQGLPATVQLNLRPDRHSNVFASGLFSKFRLPNTLF